MSIQPAHDWYLRDWMDHLGKRQADLINDLGWLKGRASKFYNGAHEYRRSIVNELADWLGIEPFELLMPPASALAIRSLRQTARTIAAESGADRFLPAEVVPRPLRRKTGT